MAKSRQYAPEYRQQMVELGRTAEELSREFECSLKRVSSQDPWLAPDPLHDPTKSTERFPRAVHGRGPPNTRAPVGGRWETRSRAAAGPD